MDGPARRLEGDRWGGRPPGMTPAAEKKLSTPVPTRPSEAPEPRLDVVPLTWAVVDPGEIAADFIATGWPPPVRRRPVDVVDR